MINIIIKIFSQIRNMKNISLKIANIFKTNIKHKKKTKIFQ